MSLAYAPTITSLKPSPLTSPAPDTLKPNRLPAAGLVSVRSRRRIRGDAAVVDVRASRERAGCGVVGRTDDHVGEAVLVHIAGTRDRCSEFVAGALSRQYDIGDGIERRAAEVDVRATGVGSARVVPPCAHDHVGERVPVHIAGARHGDPEVVAARDARHREVGGGVRRRSAQEQECSPRLRRPAGVRTDDHVVEAVVIDVARAGHRVAEEIVRREPVERQVGDVVGLGSAEEHVRATAAAPVRVVVRRADDDVVEPVAVDVARGPHRLAEPVARGLAREHDVGRRIGERPTEVEKRASSVRSRLIVAGRAYDDVAIAIAIEVAGLRYGGTERVTLGRAGRGQQQIREGAVGGGASRRKDHYQGAEERGDTRATES